MGTVPTRYHVSLDVADRAGVLAAISGEFARRGVSIAAVRQTGGDGTSARLVVVTHVAPEAALSATVEAIVGLEIVHGVNSVLRVEDLGRKGVAG
jgi:homoserine dehydrogenase